MNNKKILIPVFAGVFFFGILIGAAFRGSGTAAAKSSQPPIENQVYLSEHFAMDQVSQQPQSMLTGLSASSIPVQGRLTNTAGAPVNGDTTLTFSLYEVPSGGSEICSDKHVVPVTNGLFSTIIEGCPANSIYGQQLYLGITVSGDTEMTPRQAIYPVPYALSLIPGAIINNIWAGRGLEVKSSNATVYGTALWVENTNETPGGIGVWSVVNGGDASIIASNNGSGMLFKGFGSDGGEDEFRVNNDGAIETKADSYFFIPANLLVKKNHLDTLYWDSTFYGGVIIRSGALEGGLMDVVIPITIPAQFYGQPVKVENVWITYKVTSPSGNSYIAGATLFRQTDILNYDTLFTDTTIPKSSTPYMHQFPAPTNNVLDANRGGLALLLNLNFVNGTDSITIGSIRIQLGHHDLD